MEDVLFNSGTNGNRIGGHVLLAHIILRVISDSLLSFELRKLFR